MGCIEKESGSSHKSEGSYANILQCFFVVENVTANAVSVAIGDNGNRLIFEYGYSGRKIGYALNIPKSTVIDVCAKYSATESVESIKRSGRPTSVGARRYRKLERIVKVNRRSSSSDITAKFNEENVHSVFKRTVQRHLHNHDF